MANKSGGLGRGLGALFGNQANLSDKPKDIVQEILTASILPNRYQPRRDFDENSLKELAESIKAYGILQPIIVRSLEVGSYELIAGERRLRAAKIVGLEKVPAIIRAYTDAQAGEISIIENVQRQDLSVIEEAQSYERLIKEFGYTQDALSAKIGRSRSHIANIIRMLKLVPKVREFVANGMISMGQARPLLAIEDAELQTKVAEIIVVEDLSVRKVEAFINEMKNSGLIPSDKPQKNSEEILPESSEEISTDTKRNKKVREKKIPANQPAPQNNYVRLAENRLSEIIGAKVKIISDASKKQIQINFSDDEQLLRIIRNLDKNIPTFDSKPAITKEEKISALRKFSTEGIAP